MSRWKPWLLAAALAAPAAAQTQAGGAVPATLSGGPGEWTLLRGGRPYFIRGGGGGSNLDAFVAHGGNSIRTWGAGGLADALAQADSRGLTVLGGLWLGHKSDGFDYTDPAQVAAQQNAALATVAKYKDEPALLAWGVGNEMEAGNDTPELWKAVNALAEKIKEIDPAHPTVTVVAEISASKLDNIRRYAPAIDILGVNAYGSAATLSRRLADAGWTKPYILTEFGPPGPWESAKTPWGAPLELTSTRKADVYRRSYEGSVLGAPGRCLGSYAFQWGFKQEGSATWFGMLMPDTLETLGAVDAVSQEWTGRRPDNVAPEIAALDFKETGREVDPAAPLKACVRASDPDGDPIAATWRLRKDVKDAPDLLAGASAAAGPCAAFAAPFEPGPYRLYVELRDGRGHGATASAPFLVRRTSP